MLSIGLGRDANRRANRRASTSEGGASHVPEHCLLPRLVPQVKGLTFWLVKIPRSENSPLLRSRLLSPLNQLVSVSNLFKWPALDMSRYS